MEVDVKNLDGWALSIEAFQWIRENIKEGSTILELGSGRGTIELCKFYNVYSVEHDKNWMGMVKNCNYIYSPLIDGWYDRDILKEKLPIKYDLLIVDGPIRQDRVNFIKHYGLFKHDIPIIFDDTQRDYVKQMVLSLSDIWKKSIEEHKSTKKNFSILI